LDLQEWFMVATSGSSTFIPPLHMDQFKMAAFPSAFVTNTTGAGKLLADI
jgi:hypothetical protein